MNNSKYENMAKKKMAKDDFPLNGPLIMDGQRHFYCDDQVYYLATLDPFNLNIDSLACDYGLMSKGSEHSYCSHPHMEDVESIQALNS